MTVAMGWPRRVGRSRPEGQPRRVRRLEKGMAEAVERPKKRG